MSYRDALKVFKLERALNDDETAFLNTLRAMSESERELLVESLSPQTKKPTKKAATKSTSKSRRRTGISDAIKGTAGAAGRPANADEFAICTYTYPKDGSINPGLSCGEYASNAIHDKQAGYAGYHEFVPVATTAKDDNYQEQAGAVTGD